MVVPTEMTLKVGAHAASVLRGGRKSAIGLRIPLEVLGGQAYLPVLWRHSEGDCWSGELPVRVLLSAGEEPPEIVWNCLPFPKHLQLRDGFAGIPMARLSSTP